jgi:hypothetical protein
MVTNGGGSPFLNKLSSGDQSAVMFLFPSDAQKMLKAVLKARRRLSNRKASPSIVGASGGSCCGATALRHRVLG